uniref:UBC core domain-containing protein n=1 Tax=Oryza meridionalis TaxID=40149 RepID=A0A0E0E828_9ORYZ
MPSSSSFPNSRSPLPAGGGARGGGGGGRSGGGWSGVTFKTRIYYCNVDSTGNLSMDILREGWSPAFTISKVLLATKAIIANPDPWIKAY